MAKLSAEWFGSGFMLIDETPLFSSKFYSVMQLAVKVWLSVSIFGSLIIWIATRENALAELLGLYLSTIVMFFIGRNALTSLNKANSNIFMARVSSSVTAVRVGVLLFMFAVASGEFLVDTLGYHFITPLMGQVPDSWCRVIMILLGAALMAWVALRVGETFGKVHKYAALDKRLIPCVYHWADGWDLPKVFFNDTSINGGEFQPIGGRLRPRRVSKLFGETEAAASTFLVGILSGVMMCLTALDGDFAGWFSFAILNTSMIIMFYESVLCESRDILYRNLFAYHNYVVEAKNSTLIADKPSEA